jgi:hypothetical protein
VPGAELERLNWTGKAVFGDHGGMSLGIAEENGKAWLWMFVARTFTVFAVRPTRRQTQNHLVDRTAV